MQLSIAKTIKMTTTQFLTEEFSLKETIKNAQSELEDLRAEFIKKNTRFDIGDKIECDGKIFFIEGAFGIENGRIKMQLSEPTLKGERRKFPIITKLIIQDKLTLI